MGKLEAASCGRGCYLYLCSFPFLFLFNQPRFFSLLLVSMFEWTVPEQWNLRTSLWDRQLYVRLWEKIQGKELWKRQDSFIFRHTIFHCSCRDYFFDDSFRRHRTLFSSNFSAFPSFGLLSQGFNRYSHLTSAPQITLHGLLDSISDWFSQCETYRPFLKKAS